MGAPNVETGSLVTVFPAGPDGHKIGSSATDKISFYGVTPVVQAAAITVTAGDTSTVIAAKVVAIVAALKGVGIIAT